ncbi:NAD(P)-dependent alcohol dehydrogenase [Pseudonocardia sp. S2-4]|uniref:NAD(P)-dependent alcohol dehydrogenase n=2 Tax=Pseudonocardia humida TaxID=2800819 RepID=A0ABT1ACC0_9PSEU|nr:NAD(P)-dependent alcohol dehydrogenase [Pseudonocardia humida]
MHVAEVPTPVPAAGEVLVAVHGAGVGGGEQAIRAGELRRLLRGTFPRGVGVDFAGRVAAVGAGVTRTLVGDAVWGIVPHGTFGSSAEYVAVPQQRVAPIPDGLDLVTAAALPSVGTTAIRALVHEARLAPGARLLVRGGAGGVGSVAVQLGAALGAHVTALAGAGALDWVRGLGAAEALDYRDTPPGALPRFDVVLDLVGTDIPAYRRRLTRGGRYVGLAVDPARPVRSATSAVGNKLRNPRRYRMFSNDPSPELLADLTRRVEAGEIRPLVAGRLPLEGVVEAHRRLEAGGVKGRYVLETGKG